MKWKVQPQRKFAQGAYIPPAHNNNNVAVPERRVDVTPNKDEQKSVYHNNMSAKNLLDIVSFQSMHRHFQPVVVLERMLDTPNNNGKEAGEKGPVEKIVSPQKESSTQKATLSTSAPPPKMSHTKASPIIRKGMCLRSMNKHVKNANSSFGGVKKKIKKTNLKRPMLPSKTASRKRACTACIPAMKKMKRKRIERAPTESSAQSDFCLEDDRPLMFFKNVPVRTRSQSSQDNVTNTSNAVSPVRKEVTGASCSNVASQVSVPLRKEVTGASCSRVVSQANVPRTSKQRPNSRLKVNQRASRDRTTKSHSEKSRSLALPPKKRFGKATKKPTTPRVTTAIVAPPAEQTMEQPQNADIPERTENVEDDNTPLNSKPQSPAPSSTTGFYGVNGIERWMNNSLQNVCNEEIQPEPSPSVNVDDTCFKMPLPPRKKMDCNSTFDCMSRRSAQCADEQASNISRKCTGRASSCPSERYVTVRDIIYASKHDLELCCRNCANCCRINKVVKLSALVRKPRRLSSVNTDDVYDFDDTLDAIGLSAYRHKRRSARTHHDSATSNDEEHHVYLDLLPDDSPHIIEITSVKIPNQEKRMMRARLVSKTKSKSSNEFSLIEHENLLDQLMQTLILNKLQNEANRKKTTEAAGEAAGEVSGEAVEEASVEAAEEVSGEAAVKATEESTGKAAGVATGETAEEAARKDAGEATRQTADNQPKPSTSQCKSRHTNFPTSRETSKKLKERDERMENSCSFPRNPDSSRVLKAPVFEPTQAEFSDPIAYFERIMPTAARFGLCKVIAPPEFTPSCTLNDDIRFTVTNQYIARMYNRWGPAAREMCAIKAYLSSQSVIFSRAPLVEGLEVNLPKLYHLVQHNGGLKKVIEKKRWSRVAEEMHFTKVPNPEKKLDQVYVKYLLPYDTLSNQERQQMMFAVEKCWNKKNQKMLDRALNPLHRQKRMLGESESSGDETEDDESSNVAGALAEAEDCVVPGRSMNLATFKKVAKNAMQTHFLTANGPPPGPCEVENEYWRLVLRGTDHICVNTASIDTGDEGYGFTKNKNDPYGKHPWNLKMLSQNDGNVLRSLGPVLGVTVPTLHLGMVFSTSCWHRDPHGLPWIEYLHAGPGKIWYGIPNERSDEFREAVETLCPSYCQNKSIWLPSDIAMIPPRLLLERGVSLSRLVQRPREFVIVFPKAYSCSICTGYTRSESVYFAPTSWLGTVRRVFREVRDGCEPTMFSLERLLLAAARDPRAPAAVLRRVHGALATIVADELRERRALERLGVRARPPPAPAPRRRPAGVAAGAWNVREQDECQLCRATLHLSKVTGLAGRRAALCLHHALRLLETPRHRGRDTSAVELIALYSPDELERVVRAVRRRLFP